jgi:hypothetical protein
VVGVVFLSAAAADNVGVDGVRFSVDGVALSPTPCRVGWGVLGLLAGALGCDRAELADDLPLGFGHFVDVQPTAMARIVALYWTGESGEFLKVRRYHRSKTIASQHIIGLPDIIYVIRH